MYEVRVGEAKSRSAVCTLLKVLHGGWGNGLGREVGRLGPVLR